MKKTGSADQMLNELDGLLPPKGKVKKITEYLKYTFSEKELLEIGRNLGRSSHEIQRLEGELDAFKKQMNAQTGM